MKMKFVGTHLEHPEYRAFKADAKQEGRTIRGQLRFLAKQHLATIGFVATTPKSRCAKKKGPRA